MKPNLKVVKEKQLNNVESKGFFLKKQDTKNAELSIENKTDESVIKLVQMDTVFMSGSQVCLMDMLKDEIIEPEKPQ